MAATRTGTDLTRLAALLLVLAFASGCTAIAFGIANTATLFGKYERSVNHPYGTARQKLDVYAPPRAADCPVVIFWYGGGWTSGHKGNYRFVGAALAQRGFVAVLPDYRLYPEVKFPAFIDDGAEAIAWVQKHAREYGGDPRRIVFMGHSAGAHEAALLAYDRKRLVAAGIDAGSVVGLVGLSGPYALEPNSDLLNTIFAKPFTPADWQPVRFVSPQSPPTFLAHGEADTTVSIEHSRKLRDALQASHVRVETRFYPGKGHADTVAALSVPARSRLPVLDQATKFMHEVAGSCAATVR
jgi:acetyl esterase/lipase